MMHKVHIEPHWRIERDGSARAYDTHALLALLDQVQRHASIAEAARMLSLSYRHAWDTVRQAEAHFGAKLLVTRRGRGATLTRLAQALLWADKRIAARLSPMLQSLASELASELDRLAQQDQSEAPPTLRLRASHGFAVAALLEQMAAEHRPVELGYRSSSDALASLARRDCDMAGFHVPLGRFEAAALAHYSRWLEPRRHALVHLAIRTEGLFVAPGNPKRIARLQDLARADVRFVNRQEGSGTRMLLDLMLRETGLAPAAVNGYGTNELTHAAVAAHVASGMADVGLGVEMAARRFGLAFVPLVRERYFFAVERDALEVAPLRDVVAILQSPAFRARIDALDGYDAAQTGTIQTLAEAFGLSARPG